MPNDVIPKPTNKLLEAFNRDFLEAFTRTMVIEGKNALSNNVYDPGGMTFSGISRVYWPSWEGWKLIDEWLCKPKGTPLPSELEKMVLDFYRVNFWQRIQGDVLAEISPDIAYEVFDSAVNLDVTQAVKFLQAGFNVGSGRPEDVAVDGQLGPKTIDAIRGYLATRPGDRKMNEEILLNCMNGEQYIHYRENPKHKYFRGWFRRV